MDLRRGRWRGEHERAAVSEVSERLFLCTARWKATDDGVWGSEVAPAKERGKFVTMNHVGFITGLAAGLW